MGGYDEKYYQCCCGAEYVRDERTLGFYAGVAEAIVRTLGPGTVLDAGCAKGFLVEALRDRGVDAWGIDISEYAVNEAAGSAKGYCRVGSILDPPDRRRYDLAVCIEVLEHLPPAEASRAVANLCATADDVLFSSTSDDYAEVTHINVRPPEDWAAEFARHGFMRDLEFDATFLTPWAMRFRRAEGVGLADVVRAYDRHWWRLRRENQMLRTVNKAQQAEQVHLAGVVEQQQEVMQWRHNLLQSPAWRVVHALQLARHYAISTSAVFGGLARRLRITRCR